MAGVPKKLVVDFNTATVEDLALASILAGVEYLQKDLMEAYQDDTVNPVQLGRIRFALGYLEGFQAELERGEFDVQSAED